MIDIAQIDAHLTHQGNFCLIDWLLSNNQLPYAAYEAWRQGEQAHVDQSMQLDAQSLIALFANTEECCQALGLYSDPQDYYSWNAQQPMTLLASDDTETHQQLTQNWLRPQDVPQLDLFMDNTAVVTENQLRNALNSRQSDLAQQHLERLTEFNPRQQHLGAYQDLINYCQHIQATSAIEASALGAELQGLKEEVCPLAKEILGPAARDYLAFAWRRLANNLQEVSFDAQQPDLHLSYALMQIPDWPALQRCLINDPMLYVQCQLMDRLGESYIALQQVQQSLLLWCVMMEQHSDYAESLIQKHPEHVIHSLWQAFWEFDDDNSRVLFPAFVLLKQPGLIHHLNEFPSLKHPASQTMITLLKCRLAGEDEIFARAQLQQVSPVLLRIYLQTRVPS